jgi:type II secretory ATPase GspE/PulE/Tfp pilus assembly ATPase PilB-like protein
VNKERAMAAMDVKKKMLGEMLVAGGLIKEEQLKQALEDQKTKGGGIGEILVNLGLDPFKMLRQEGLLKVAAGVTSVEEMLRVAQETEEI